MAWVLLDDNFPNHPKAVQAGPVASYLFICGLCYCRRFHTDGFIPMKAIPALGLTARPARMIDALVEVGLWDRLSDGSGFTIHGYSAFYADVTEKANKENRRKSARKAGIESRRVNGSRFNVERVGTGLVVLDPESTPNVSLAGFDAFWDLYPRSDGKQPAKTEWDRLQPDAATYASIMADVERRRTSRDWLKDNGQFIPHARTYLRQRRWEDGHKDGQVQRVMSDAAAMVFDTLVVKP